MANYLVTGGAGFIGSNLVEHLLERGDVVRVLDNFATGRRENIAPFLDQIELIEGDLRNPEDCTRACDDMDYVLHQAALPSVARSVEDPLDCNAVNVEGTLNLLQACREAEVRRVVYAASSSAYGDQPAEFKVESMAPRPRSPYAVAKLAAEHYMQAFAVCYGMETVCLRYFNVFGPRQDPNSQYSAVIPKFIRAALNGQRPVVYGDGLQSRDFTFIANNVQANILAATADFEARGQAINIACGRSYSLLDLLAAIEKILDIKLEPEFTHPRAGDVKHSKAGIALARDTFGYEVGISFEEGLSRTIDWLRNHD
ncbi:SDR family oxidoreductase [Candidatus Sumerlaeota bacterium]|nr:SDR family oxidoreductase [Candidatus Sumerlaeota bacterium]